MKEILGIIGSVGKWLILFPFRLLFFLLNFIPTTVKSCRTCPEVPSTTIYYQETGNVQFGTFLYAWTQGFYKKYNLIEGPIIEDGYGSPHCRQISKSKKAILEEDIAHLQNGLSLFH